MAEPYQRNTLSEYVVRSHGGKRALLQAGWHLLRSGLGAFGPYRRIDWQQVSRVVFVCKGNICRSAFAAERFRGAAPAVASAGLDADSGKPADPRAIQVARRFGVDLADHRSTHVSELELGAADLLVAFEPDQAERLGQLAACRAGAQVTLLGLWGPPPALPHLHDPYGLPEAYFETCFRRIEGGLEGLRLRFSGSRTALGGRT